MTVTPRKTAERKPRRDTRTRIVECAISLFNRHGLQSVTIEQICTKLTISPGNLTYHFKRKDDLIRAALDVLRTELQVVLQKPDVSTARHGAEYLIRIFNTFWAFRFYFNAMAFLLTDNPTMRKEHEEVRNWTIEAIGSGIGYLESRGVFHQPVAPNNFHLLSDNIWALLLNWLRQEQVLHPAAIKPSKTALFDMSLHLWSLCQLWMEPKWSKDLLFSFQTLLSQPVTLSSEAKAA